MKENVRDDITDAQGEYYDLMISIDSEHVTPEEYAPYDLQYPNACRYSIGTYDPQNGVSETLIVHDMERKERMVIALKKAHGIVDPWDQDIESYRKKWQQIERDRQEISPEEEKALEEEILRRASEP